MCSMVDNHVDVIRDIDSGCADNNISGSPGSSSLITDWFPHSTAMSQIGQSSSDMSGLAFTQIQIQIQFLFLFDNN